VEKVERPALKADRLPQEAWLEKKLFGTYYSQVSREHTPCSGAHRQMASLAVKVW
jgi:hypothetical protein